MAQGHKHAIVNTMVVGLIVTRVNEIVNIYSKHGVDFKMQYFKNLTKSGAEVF